jgi:hypothetical protein
MRITVVSPNEAPRRPASGQIVVNTTSHNKELGRLLSPFHLGPVDLYGGRGARNMENAWQYAKVYSSMLEKDGTVGPQYFAWAEEGWANPQAVRYPVRKGAKPLFSLWDGVQLDYVSARKAIYLPLYRDAVRKSGGYHKLKELAETCDELVLVDFDGYDHRKAGLSYANVLNNGQRSMGHAFVLAMMLEFGPHVEVSELESACGFQASPQQTSLF